MSIDCSCLWPTLSAGALAPATRDEYSKINERRSVGVPAQHGQFGSESPPRWYSCAALWPQSSQQDMHTGFSERFEGAPVQHKAGSIASKFQHLLLPKPIHGQCLSLQKWQGETFSFTHAKNPLPSWEGKKRKHRYAFYCSDLFKAILWLPWGCSQFFCITPFHKKVHFQSRHQAAIHKASRQECVSYSSYVRRRDSQQHSFLLVSSVPGSLACSMAWQLQFVSLFCLSACLQDDLKQTYNPNIPPVLLCLPDTEAHTQNKKQPEIQTHKTTEKRK